MPDFSGGGAHYVVFWYRSYPLGDRYMKLNGAIAESDFWSECMDAIWPSLESYHCLYHRKGSLHKPHFPNAADVRVVCGVVLEDFQPVAADGGSDVSVIICTRNRAGHLRKCLAQLQQQRYQPSEIIVVDNASAGNETRNLCSEFSNVRYVREERPGLDIARNHGVTVARSHIVAFTDDDTLPDPWWVYQIDRTFNNPAIDAMTGLVLAASLDTEAEVIFEKFWPFNRGYVQKLFDHNFFNSTLEAGPPVWEIGAGANMAFRKSIFEDTGYFDERLDVGAAGCSGDSELWYRILANGSSIMYNPLAVVHHCHRHSIRDLKKQLYNYMRGFTVAILIQYQRFGHIGNLKHLLTEIPVYYLSLLKRGFPRYLFQYQTLFAEMGGIFSGIFYYWRHRRTDPRTS